MKDIPDNEELARFILFRSHYSVKKRRIKFSAFMPPRNKREVSVFCISGLDEKPIWDIGYSEVHNPEEGRTLRARGDLYAQDARDLDLDVVPETSTHERHANIEGFPKDEVERKNFAIELARVAKLVVVPDDY